MSRQQILRLWLPVLVWMAIIFLLSSRPATSFPSADILITKGYHVAAYALLAILLYRALRGVGLQVRAALLVAWLGTVLYGVTDEVHQLFVPTRHGSIVDVGIDAVGAALGLIVVRLTERVLHLWQLRQQDVPE